MHLKTLLTLTLAAAVSSTPAAGIVDRSAELVAPSQLISRARNPCDGGRQYCGWFDKANDITPQCKCPPGQKFDSKKRKCNAPPMKKPKVGKKQKAICARGKNDFCDYDEKADQCREDGKGVVIVIDIDIEITIVKEQIDEECKRPKCAVDQHYDEERGRCRFTPMPRESANKCKKKGGRAVCARTPKDFCDYDEDEDFCEDDGINCFKCIESREKPEKALKGSHADVDKAIGAMGFDCLCDGVCNITKSVFGLLGAIDDAVGGIICSVLGLINLC